MTHLMRKRTMSSLPESSGFFTYEVAILAVAQSNRYHPADTLET